MITHLLLQAVYHESDVGLAALVPNPNQYKLNIFERVKTNKYTLDQTTPLSQFTKAK